MSRKQNITTIFRGGNRDLPQMVQRMVIHSSRCIDSMEGGNRFTHLRSLIFFEPMDSSPCKSLLKLLSDGYRLLKVLELGGEQIKMIPSEVFRLLHLEYLSLRGTQVEIIPKPIGKLKKLQCLDLKDTNVTELPIQILMLLHLQYLSVRPIEAIGFKAPYEIGSLKSRKHCAI
ncbi:hypothetical protein ACH5RR_039033 [Cinchona calisaya]|uniref:Disease resistance R13L4/SHOC-2-like LRR domain-containing protein n=1 Tax=Cinchona calisaya TaxID=153742 RepID=A0ABD2XZZ4_9GENT